MHALSTLRFLIKYRERPARLSRFFVVWVKRTLNLPGLLFILWRGGVLGLSGASIGAMTVIGKARIVGDRKKLRVGAGVSIGACKIILHDDVIIGKNAVINDDVSILTASHKLQDPLWGQFSAPIHIEEYAWVAEGAIILPGVKIGRGAVVGAGAVVRKDIPAYALAIGNPALIIENKRINEFRYLPVFFNAPYEAWLGKTSISL